MRQQYILARQRFYLMTANNPSIHFISFSGSINNDRTSSIENDALITRQKLLNQSAISCGGVKTARCWTREDLLDTAFYRRHKPLLDSRRGAGYWAWKPYIILQTLESVPKDEWVVYYDVGKPFRRGDNTRAGNLNIGNIIDMPLQPLINHFSAQGFLPGTWVPHYGINASWTKRDCFIAMQCDNQHYWQSSQVQATFSAWSNSKKSIEFLNEWLSYCLRQEVITDEPNILGANNADSFKEHRHDQSILTNLCIKYNCKALGSPTKTPDAHRDLAFQIRILSGHSNTLNTSALNIEHVFNGQHPVLPQSLLQAFTYFAIPALLEHKQILLIDNKPREQDSKNISKAFPDCTLNTMNISQKTKNTTASFKECNTGLILLRPSGDKKTDIRAVGTAFTSLAKNGVLIVGPIMTETPKANFMAAESVSEKDTATLIDNHANDDISCHNLTTLFDWIFTHQCFPKNMTTEQYSQPNSITIGNAVNPVITRVDNHVYALIRKPKFNVLLALQQLNTKAFNPPLTSQEKQD